MTTFWLKSCALLLAATIASPMSLSAQIDEGFEDVEGLEAAGWVLIDNSTPLSPFSLQWFQGLTLANGFFDAFSPPANSYTASSFTSVDLGDPDAEEFTLDNWLLTPEVELVNGAMFSFFTRTLLTPRPIFADHLEVRLSTNGASVDIGTDNNPLGDFSDILLFDINPGLRPSGYPFEWTQYSATLSGISEPASGRFAFRHFVTDAQNNGNYIGLDDVTYLVAPMQVPEPSSMLLLLAGTVGVAFTARRRRSHTPSLSV